MDVKRGHLVASPYMSWSSMMYCGPSSTRVSCTKSAADTRTVGFTGARLSTLGGPRTRYHKRVWSGSHRCAQEECQEEGWGGYARANSDTHSGLGNLLTGTSPISVATGISSSSRSTNLRRVLV